MDMLPPTPRKVIWAIDVYHSLPNFFRTAARALKRLQLETHALIEPVYILNLAHVNLQNTSYETWLEQEHPNALKALNQVVSQSGIEETLTPRVIEENSFSGVEAAQALSNYAEQEGADLIVVSTHARSGIVRFFLGSFAENLLTVSKVPLLVVGTHVNRISKFKHILFATAFLPTSHLAFRKTVQLASTLNSKITLVHVLPEPVEAIFQSGVSLLGGTWIPVLSYFGKEYDRQKKRARAWSNWAKKKGVAMTSIIWPRGGQASDLIVKVAKRKRAGLIVLEEKASLITATLVGSTTRQVIRSAHCPVFVFRSQALQKEGRRDHPHFKAA